MSTFSSVSRCVMNADSDASSSCVTYLPHAQHAATQLNSFIAKYEALCRAAKAGAARCLSSHCHLRGGGGRFFLSPAPSVSRHAAWLNEPAFSLPRALTKEGPASLRAPAELLCGAAAACRGTAGRCNGRWAAMCARCALCALQASITASTCMRCAIGCGVWLIDGSLPFGNQAPRLCYCLLLMGDKESYLLQLVLQCMHARLREEHCSLW